MVKAETFVRGDVGFCSRAASNAYSSERICASTSRIRSESAIPVFVLTNLCASEKPLSRRAAMVLSPQALRRAINAAVDPREVVHENYRE